MAPTGEKSKEASSGNLPTQEKIVPLHLKNTEAKKALLIEALSYIGRFFKQVMVIKFGGAAMVDESVKNSFAEDIVLLQSLGMLPVVVHGGGPDVNKMMQALGVETKFVNGLRVTTREGLKITEMVLSGSINKELVALMNAAGGSAVGLSGKDGTTIKARKMASVAGSDLGLVGNVESINSKLIRLLLDNGHIPVISPIGLGEDGTTYNINADTAASRIAAALEAKRFIFMTDVDGILREGELLSTLSVNQVRHLIASGVIQGGMIPKVEAILHCLEHGVSSAQIINGSEKHSIIAELFTDEGIGTKIHP